MAIKQIKLLFFILLAVVITLLLLLNLTNIFQSKSQISSIKTYELEIFDLNVNSYSIDQEKKRDFFAINNGQLDHLIKSINVIFYQAQYGLGYGNLIYSMLSAMLMAFLSDGAFLIEWSAIDRFVESPFKITFQKFNDFSYLDLNNKAPKTALFDTTTSNSWNSNKTLLTNIQIPKGDNNRLIVSNNNAFFFDLCLNPDFYPKLIEYKLVKKETVDLALRALKNQTLTDKSKLDVLFRVGFEYAGTVLNNYWRLRKEKAQRVDDLYDRLMRDKFTIGIQIRSEYLNSADLEAFVECADDIETYHMVDRAMDKPVKWFISSDDEKIIRKLKKRFGDKIISGEGSIEHVGTDDDGYDRGLLDIELLSRCNETIITGGSTFGFIASLKSQTLPYYVEGKSLVRECKRLDMSAPCRRPGNMAALF